MDMLEPIGAGRIFLSNEAKANSEIDDFPIPNDRLPIGGDARRFAGPAERLADLRVETRIESDDANGPNGAAVGRDLEKATPEVASCTAVPGHDHVVARDAGSTRDGALRGSHEFIEVDSAP
jgi:hypothetical protein